MQSNIININKGHEKEAFLFQVTQFTADKIIFSQIHSVYKFFVVTNFVPRRD